MEVVTELKHPFTGETADIESIDALCGMLEQVKKQRDALYVLEQECRQALTLLTESDAKTRHLYGEQFEAKVTMPADKWDNAVLKSLWENGEYGIFVEDFLTIGSIKPKLAQIDKVERGSGTPTFEKFKAELLSARSASTSAPTVSIRRRDK